MKNLYLRTGVQFVIVSVFLTFILSCAGQILPRKKVIITQPQPPAKTEEVARAKEAGPFLAPEDERRLFYQAEKAQSQSRFPEALEKYNKFLKTYPESSLTDQVRFSIGQIREKLGQYKLAAAAYQDLLTKNPKSIFVPETRYRFVVLLIKTGRFGEAYKILDSLISRTTDPAKLARWYFLAGQAEAGRLERGRALKYFSMAYKQSEDRNEKFNARDQALRILMNMPLPELVRNKPEYDMKFPAGYISYLIAYRSYRAGQVQEAQSELNYFLNNFPGHEMVGQAETLQKAIIKQAPPPPVSVIGTQKIKETNILPDQEATAGTINPTSTYESSDLACLIPLSGNASSYGQKIVKGLRLAFKLYKPQTEGFKSNLIVLDSASDPDRTIQAIDRLANQTNVLAVIGPLTSKVADVAAIRAEELSLPMLTLSQKEKVPQIGRHIFRLCLTPEEQARVVARYAVQILGFTHLAILYPEDDYGKKMRDAFWDEVNQLQAEIVGVQSYPPDTIDFSKQIQNLSGIEKVERKVEAGHVVEVNFEAVFIPDGYKAVAMIAPQFFYHDITTIRLLGTTLWHTPQLLTTASRYIQKCVFPTSFFAGTDRPEIKRFVKAFQEENEGQIPGRFEAYGFDAGMLLLNLMDKKQVTSRENLVQALNKVNNFPGVTGSISFTPEGELKTHPVLLTVIGRRFKLVQ